MSEQPTPIAHPADVLRRVPSVLRRADLALLAVKERPLRDAGVTGSHYSVLINIQVAPGMTGAELARALGVTPQAVAPLVSKLVERGLVDRRAHPRHASVQELHLTETGTRELAQADRIMIHLDDFLRERLGEDEHQRLHDLLEQVIAALPAWSPPERESAGG